MVLYSSNSTTDFKFVISNIKPIKINKTILLSNRECICNLLAPKSQRLNYYNNSTTPK